MLETFNKQKSKPSMAQQEQLLVTPKKNTYGGDVSDMHNMSSNTLRIPNITTESFSEIGGGISNQKHLQSATHFGGGAMGKDATTLIGSKNRRVLNNNLVRSIGGGNA